VDLTGIALLLAVAIGFYVFIIRPAGKKDDDGPTPVPVPVPDPMPTPTPNAPPVVHGPNIVGHTQWGNKVIIDVRHRVHGCDASGAPSHETGAFDPDGDLLSFRFDVSGPNKDGEEVVYAVFDDEGKRIDGTWLPADYFPVLRKNRTNPNDLTTEQEAVAFCIIGYEEDDPPFPFGPMACPRPMPPPAPEPKKVLGEMTVVYQAKDPDGRSRSAGVKLPVTGGGCN